MLLRVLSVLTLTCLASANLMAADDPFVGKWKANLGKSELTGTTMKVEDTGGGVYKMTFGDEVDTLVADGKEHATKYGSQRTVTPDGANVWKVVSTREGKVVTTGSFVLSEDGQMLTRTFEITQPDGKLDKEVYKDKRTGGTSGLPGTWENTSSQIGATIEIEIQPFEGDGISIVNPAYKEHDDVKFDGKDYPNVGPRVIPGAATSGQRIDPRTIELTNKVNGKPTDLERLEMSADGKTMTMMGTPAGNEKPQTMVFERQ